MFSMAARAAAAEDAEIAEAAKAGSESMDEQNAVMVFEADFDEEGVYFYQAYNDEIADWALEHQRFGGPKFKPERMTWIKPSFAWMLYRAGYGFKDVNQKRILKIKLPHSAVAELLSESTCSHGGGGHLGRVQWDPARDLMSAEGEGDKVQPMKMIGLKDRAIQIGLKGRLSVLFVERVSSIEDVTTLAHAVCQIHQTHTKSPDQIRVAISELLPEIMERAYMPHCSPSTLTALRMLPGEVAESLAQTHTQGGRNSNNKEKKKEKQEGKKERRTKCAKTE